MSILDKLEKKIGWLAVPNLMLYIVVGNAMVYITQMLTGLDLTDYLSFYLPAILQGQVWRLFSFVFIPPTIFGGSLWSLFIAAIAFLFYARIGKMTEMAMGTFAFSIYYFLGMLCVIVMGCIFPIPLEGALLNTTLFFAYAYYYPDNPILFMYIIPVPVKYIAYFSGAMLLYQTLLLPWLGKLIALAGVLNFILFFGKPLVIDKILQARRKRKYLQGRQQTTSAERGKFTVYSNPYAKSAGKKSNAKHCCEVCGRTELDSPDLEFRYCSQCEGYHEYCMDHLHQHIHKKSGEA